MMSHDLYYRKDKIFSTVNTINLLQPGNINGIKNYIIDLFNYQDWKNSGYSVVLTNNIIKTPLPHRDRIFVLDKSFYGIYYYPYDLEENNVSPSKKFNCFINRMDPIRQSWLYQLIRRKLFDQGYVSFNMDISRCPEDVVNLSEIEAFEYQYQKFLSIFTDEHEFIKNAVPYKNFEDHGDITHVVYDSKFSIVLETYFDNNDVVTYSEKTFRALQIPRPWILFSHKHAVRHLRDMGFDVLDDLVEHDLYDNLDSEIERQTQLLNISVRMVDQNFNYQRLRQAAEHNQKLLKNFSSTWVDDFNRCLKQAIQFKTKINEDINLR